MASIKKLAASFLAAALLALGAVALVGCGPNDEEVIREGVSAELDKLKNLDDETLDLLASEAGADDLATYGIDAKAFVSSYLAGFDYRIENVSVDGENATATVVLTCKSFSQYTDSLQEAVTTLAADESIRSMSEDEQNAKFGETIMSSLNGLSAVETGPIDLAFAREGNTWNATQEAEQAITSALFNN